MSKEDINTSSAIFKINTSSGSGSGFYLMDKQLVVTNCHVVLGYREVGLEDLSNNRYLAKVVYINQEVDIAFLKPEKPFDTAELEFADISLLKSRDRVLVLGFPFGMPYTETEGIVSSPNQLMNGRSYIQTDAAVNPGNSGGPVINQSGQVIGITTSKFTKADNVGFAIPVNNLAEELEALEENTELKYAVACNSCKSLTYEKSEYCLQCGAEISEQMFNEVVPTKLESFVEKAISSYGIHPVIARAGYEYWSFHSGSSFIKIFIFNKNYLFATSPLNSLPKKNLEPLYKYLLSNPAQPYFLGITDNLIYLSYRVHMSDVFSSRNEEINKALVNMLQVADDLDDYLETEYGCPKSNYAKDV